MGFSGALNNTRLGPKFAELSQETHVLILISPDKVLGDDGREIPFVGTEFLSVRCGGEKGLSDIYLLFKVLDHSHEDLGTPLLSHIAQVPPYLANTSIRDHIKPCH